MRGALDAEPYYAACLAVTQSIRTSIHKILSIRLYSNHGQLVPSSPLSFAVALMCSLPVLPPPLGLLAGMGLFVLEASVIGTPDPVERRATQCTAPSTTQTPPAVLYGDDAQESSGSAWGQPKFEVHTTQSKDKTIRLML